MSDLVRRYAPAAALLGIVLLAGRPSRGEIYRVDFSGYTTTFDNTPHSPLAPTAGTTFSGYYLYDSTTPGSLNTGPTAAAMDYRMATPFGIHVTEGDLVFDSIANPGVTQMLVRKTLGEDRFFLDSNSAITSATTGQILFPYGDVFLGFHDPSKSSFTPDLALPTTAFDPSKLSIELFLAGAIAADGITGPAGFGLNGIITAMSISTPFNDPSNPGSGMGTGLTPTDPVLPPPAQTGTYTFEQAISGRWFDPPITNAFTYKMTDGALFTHIVAFPDGFAHPFSVYANGMLLGLYGAGSSVDFTSLPDGGVSSFTIGGIDPGVDAALSDAFPLQLSFNRPTASFTMTAVPEPSSLILIGSALLIGAGYGIRRRRRLAA